MDIDKILKISGDLGLVSVCYGTQRLIRTINDKNFDKCSQACIVGGLQVTGVVVLAEAIRTLLR